MQKVIVVDPVKCYACLSCVVECAYAKASTAEPISVRILSQSRIHIEPVDKYAVPVVCRHCADAPCQTVCPTGAIHREEQESPVLVDDELCIGCKACILACPFGMIRLNFEGKIAQKCNLCIEADGGPICVRSCPSGALQLKLLEEVRAEALKQTAREIVASSESAA